MVVPKRRAELILRLPNLSPALADKLTETLAPVARRLGGSLSRIERDHYAGYQIHINRKSVV